MKRIGHWGGATLVVSFCIASFTLHAQPRARTAAAPAPRVARSAETSAERCTALQTLWVSDARAALVSLGVAAPADFEQRYRRQIRNFDTVCAALTPEQLTCLETAPNSIAAVGSCAVNEGKAFNERLDPPMVGSDMVTWQAHIHEDRSEATTAAAMAQLAGVWHRSDNYSDETFTVTAAGAATHVSTRAGQTRTVEGTIDVLSPTHLQARMSGSRYNWGFFVDGDRVLFSNQTATGAYPIAARGVTHLGFNGQFFLLENLASTPRCRAFGARLEPIDASCSWEGTGDARKLIVTTAAHRYIESGSNAMAYSMRFVERRNHLIPDGDSMFWTRVRP
ncbi:MAG: hypothetical protein IPK60_08430 [Sandaracinaceae bacterium]|jgi:hypothetical protein|nr:hypothetical protein [Sandaracinaceae bacterium]